MALHVAKAILIGVVASDTQVVPGKAAMFQLETSLRYRDTKGEIKIKKDTHQILAGGAWMKYSSDHVKKGMEVYVEAVINNRVIAGKGKTPVMLTEYLVKDHGCLISVHGNGNGANNGGGNGSGKAPDQKPAAGSRQAPVLQGGNRSRPQSTQDTAGAQEKKSNGGGQGSFQMPDFGDFNVGSHT